jgi:hypothetical protein
MINNLWSTPVGISAAPEDVCFNVTQVLLQEYVFNSEQNVFDIKSKVIKDFKNNVVIPAFNDYLKESLGKELNEWSGGYRLHGWTVSYDKDTSLDFHNHRGSQLSAVFYLLCDSSDVGGHVTFTDARQNANRGYDKSFLKWFKPLKMIPKSGDIVIFPSFLYHSVSTYRGNIRIAMPVDLFLFDKS